MEIQNTTCPCCKSFYDNQPDACTTCKYPFNGTQQEQSKFIGQYILKKGHISDTKDHLKKVRWLLWIIAAVNVLYAVYFGANENYFLAIVSLYIGVIFFICSVVTYFRPFTAVVAALVLYLLTNILPTAIWDPRALLDGLFIRGFVIVSLIHCIRVLIKARNARKEGVREND